MERRGSGADEGIDRASYLGRGWPLVTRLRGLALFRKRARGLPSLPQMLVSISRRSKKVLGGARLRWRIRRNCTERVGFAAQRVTLEQRRTSANGEGQGLLGVGTAPTALETLAQRFADTFNAVWVRPLLVLAVRLRMRVHVRHGLDSVRSDRGLAQSRRGGSARLVFVRVDEIPSQAVRKLERVIVLLAVDRIVVGQLLVQALREVDDTLLYPSDASDQPFTRPQTMRVGLAQEVVREAHVERSPSPGCLVSRRKE